MKIGAHVSIAGGCHKAPARAADLGCETFQIFTRSPRSLRGTKPLKDSEIIGFRAECHRLGFDSCMAHAPYLLNLANPDEDKRALSRRHLIIELERAQALGVPLVVLHPGSHLKTGVDAGLERVAGELALVLAEAHAPDVRLCLENTAGQGSSLGGPLWHLGTLLDAVPHNASLGFCLDTCHAFAAGYDLRTEEGWQALMNEIGETVGLDRLLCCHLNDSQGDLGSRVDRHANIGHGLIGEEAFRRILIDPRLADCPASLETPGGDEGYRADLATLRRLRQTS